MGILFLIIIAVIIYLYFTGRLPSFGNTSTYHAPATERTIGNYDIGSSNGWPDELRRNPNSAQLHYEYACSLGKASDYNNAKYHFQKSLQLDPSLAGAHFSYAFLLYSAYENNELAKRHYLEAIRLAPDFVDARFHYASVLFDEDDLENAKPEQVKILEIDPNHSGAHFGLGYYFKNKAFDFETAKYHYEKAAENEMYNAEPHFALANLLKENLRDYDLAKYHYEQAISINPNDTEIADKYDEFIHDYFLGANPARDRLLLSSKDIDVSMIRVDGGIFDMGYDKDDFFSKPSHKVQVDTFYIGVYPVLQWQWFAVMGIDPSNNPRPFHGKEGNYPVENISWEDAQSFVSELNKVSNKRYRLPTDAEWEYAARGGKGENKRVFSGSDVLDDVGWYMDNANYHTHPVATKLANELGLYDMTGNVSEWCSDYFSDDPIITGDVTKNPSGIGYEEAMETPYKASRVIRGGCYLSEGYNCRLSYRGCANGRFKTFGLRLVVDESSYSKT
jgi:formylglycine-generating enzyme required for sulfatase activity/Tfp pilus assembly protein PilF